MPREWPVMECLHCHFQWNRYAKRKLTPSRQCRGCLKYMKVEHEDYEWVSTGRKKLPISSVSIKTKPEKIDTEISVWDLIRG